MTKRGPAPKKPFEISPRMSNPARQPLEVYHLSHDLRGPLNSILGFSELLLEGVEGPLTDYQQADLTAIYQSAQNLLRLINDLVDLSKLEADRLKLDAGPVQLQAVFQNIESFDFGPNKPEGVALVAKVSDALPPVRGDRDRVEQMVMSLVRFLFKRLKQGQVVITAEAAGAALLIRVEAKELVLSPAIIEELFELAVHVDSAGRSELGPGGLALPLIRALVDRQQGQLRVKSDEAGGTSFYLELPRFEE